VSVSVFPLLLAVEISLPGWSFSPDVVLVPTAPFWLLCGGNHPPIGYLVPFESVLSLLMLRMPTFFFRPPFEGGFPLSRDAAPPQPSPQIRSPYPLLCCPAQDLDLRPLS